MSNNQELSLPKLMFASFVGANIGEILTLPFDTAKVRMQIFQGKYNSLIHCIKSVSKEEGLRALYNGASAGVLRQSIFAPLRIGLFDYYMQYLKNKKGEENITIMDRINGGIFTGAFGITIANPADTMKVRFQADMKSKSERRYKNIFDAGVKIYQQEGLKGFYQSLFPNIVRNSIMNAVELATYTQCKYLLKDKYKLLNDGFWLYASCSSVAGLFAVMLGSPADVIKSRVMDGKLIDGKKVPYNSVFEAVKSLHNEKGVKGFYKGFEANFYRLVGWNMIMFIAREEVINYFKKQNNK